MESGTAHLPSLKAGVRGSLVADRKPVSLSRQRPVDRCRRWRDHTPVLGARYPQNDRAFPYIVVLHLSGSAVKVLQSNARHPMLLTVKSAVAEDEQAVVALSRACDLVASYNDPVADFRFAKAGPCSDVLVAVDDAGEVAGSVMVGHDGHRGWLYYVAARPTSRSKGVGRRMVQAAENWLRQRGIVKVQLLVRETNTKVVSFYEHLGFEVAPRVVMSRWLGKTS